MLTLLTVAGSCLCCWHVVAVRICILVCRCLQEHQVGAGVEDCIDKDTFFKSLGAGQYLDRLLCSDRLSCMLGTAWHAAVRSCTIDPHR